LALPSFWGTPGGMGTTFSSQACTTFDLTWLFVILPTPHFLLEATSFNKLAEAADRLLNRFAVANTHYNHWFS
jgi:hypothetical protein